MPSYLDDPAETFRRRRAAIQSGLGVTHVPDPIGGSGPIPNRGGGYDPTLGSRLGAASQRIEDNIAMYGWDEAVRIANEPDSLDTIMSLAADVLDH